ncbi:xylulokinase [Cellulomonas denverensis]|uniref:Xylulose kinase n=1 Tax=Cellulomonas denverensis TaxID=264297 RepID=A0A7X6KU18_9CELL|nr:xylulokinase [Cellulomonas denverensis]NKY22143.1 xylulokinase [Cellulomonas denverensis]GIG26096.1 xylulose kinase [Cellulomonas denverensis]
MGVVAGVDSSTQSCTVELRDADDGRLLGSGRAPHPATAPPVSEQDPADWWAALRLALAAALGQAGLTADRIDAVGIAAQCHGPVLLDDRDRVLRPVKLWNDTTSSPQAAAMVAELGMPGWADAVGSVPTAAFTITKLAWVAEHEPELLDRTRRVLLPHDWLSHRLTGRAVTDRSEASGTGYYAAHEGRYLTGLLDRWVRSGPDWAAMLPEVAGPSEAAGPADTAAAAELGLRPDVVVGAGAGDQHAGALGIGLGPGQVLYSLGTSGVVMTTSSVPVHDGTGWVDGVADAAGGWLPLMCSLNSTKVTDTVARLLGVGLDELAALALAAERRPDRMVLAAYLDGERTPDRPDARGLLGGLRTDATREELALAAHEGVVLGLLRGHQAIVAAGAAADGEVVVAGGGGRSPAYRQVLADALGRPVHTRDAAEATARGAAVQAAAVLAGADVTAVRDAWAPATTSVTEPGGPLGDDLLDRYRALADWRQPTETTTRERD